MTKLPHRPRGIQLPKEKIDKSLSNNLEDIFSGAVENIKELEHQAQVLANVRATLIVNYARSEGRMTDGVVIEDINAGNALQLMFNVLQQYHDKLGELQDTVRLQKSALGAR